ncbi:MAG: 4Fe-4S binding protein, partial [Clostridia bacterium]|nr:4Fe-4S binding protein [Clostridia bacterium]
MKKFFSKIGNFFKKLIPSKRRLIQLYAALLYNANLKGYISGQIYQGNTKYVCVPGMNCYSCPGAIGSCPLGALQNALNSADKTAPYYVLGILALFGLFLGRTICGFLCPIGLVQDLTYKIKTPKLKKSKYTRVISYLKYVLLAVFVIAIPLALSSPGFCKYICPAGVEGGALGLLSNPNRSDLFDSLGWLFTWKFCLTVVIIVASVFIYRVFCRFICPLGAIYGFFNKIALLGIKLEKDKCTDCGLCVAECKMDVLKVGDHECINCGECIKVCPTKAITWKGSKIFLRGSEIDTPAVENPVPLSIKTDGAVAVENTEKEVAVTQINTKAEKIKKRNFWLQFAAWATAIAVLGVAIWFFNFHEKDAETVESLVGSVCPEFELEIYERGENGEFLDKDELTFKPSDYKGKVTVLNYWGWWCPSCVEEIPHFEQLFNEYSEKLNMVFIHSPLDGDLADALGHMNGYYTQYNAVFAQDAVGEYTVDGEIISIET